jgi:hypothetical protein
VAEESRADLAMAEELATDPAAGPVRLTRPRAGRRLWGTTEEIR